MKKILKIILIAIVIIGLTACQKDASESQDSAEISQAEELDFSRLAKKDYSGLKSSLMTDKAGEQISCFGPSINGTAISNCRSKDGEGNGYDIFKAESILFDHTSMDGIEYHDTFYSGMLNSYFESIGYQINLQNPEFPDGYIIEWYCDQEGNVC